MPREIIIIDSTVSQRHATLLATAAVTTAQSPLAGVFGASPEYELVASPKQAEGMNNILTNETAFLKRRLGERIDPNDVSFFKEVFHRILKIVARDNYKEVNCSYEGSLAELLKKLGLRRNPKEPLSKLLKPFEIKAVEVDFKKVNERHRGRYIPSPDYSTKREYDKSGGIVKLTCTQGRPLVEYQEKPHTYDDRAPENLMGKMVTEGFGDLTGQVGLRVTDRGCNFLWNNKLIASTKRVSEGLENFRDAAVWLWLKALAEEYKVEAKGTSDEWQAELGSAVGATALDSAVDTNESPNIGLAMYLHKMRLNVPEFPKESPDELKGMVTELEKKGMFQEAKTYVKKNTFVVDTRDDTLLIKPNGKHYPVRVCQEGMDCLWYRRIAKLFGSFVKARNLRVGVD